MHLKVAQTPTHWKQKTIKLPRKIHAQYFDHKVTQSAS
jgi:hypothetical protein